MKMVQNHLSTYLRPTQFRIVSGIAKVTKIIHYSKLLEFYVNPFENDYIILPIKHKHGFLVVQESKIRDKVSKREYFFHLFVPIQSKKTHLLSPDIETS